MQQAKLDEIDEFDKNVSLIFDEMKIKSGLVFSKTTGTLVGFCETREVNDETEKFSKATESQAETEKQSLEPGSDRNIAKYVSNCVYGERYFFKLAVCIWSREGSDSDQIFHCALEAIRVLESIRLYVRAKTADVVSPNRKYFNLHKSGNQKKDAKDDVVFWIYNPWAPLRKTYFICDVPPLKKNYK